MTLNPKSFPSPEPRWYSSRNTAPSPAPRGRQPRKGVVLLIVISLLALFVLLGITYSLSVSQYSRASLLNIKQEQVGDPPHIEADLILGQILYDTSARTVLQYQGLLRDLYGYDGNVISNPATVVGGHYPQFRESIQGAVTLPSGTPPIPNGLSGGNQFYTFTFTLPLPNPIPATPVPLPALSPIPNYYAGRVITFQSGACTNHSTRIVAYNPIRQIADITVPTPASGQITIEAIESKLAGSITNLIVPNDQFVINGAPFNGAGSGYYYDANNLASPNNYGINNTYAAPDPANVGSRLAAYPVSLLPNIGAYDTTLGALLNNANGFDYGGLDESWDAPDLQNMFLAMVPPAAAASFAAGQGATIIPSFHRPELVNFWINQLQSATDPRDLSAATTIAAMTQAQKDFLRTIVFRPMPWDHPNFTGSNPAFANTNVQTLLNALRGQNALGNITPAVWDVDNDNDGVPDSIWLDPGLPVVTSPDGRRYKRLASILIKDLDGSLNINAHGNLAQVQVAGGMGDNRYRAEYQPVFNPTFPMLPGYTPPPTGSNPYPYVLGLTPDLSQINNTFFIPRGMGFGPAEVDFLKIFATSTPAYNDPNAVTAYTNLLRSRYISNTFVANANPDSGINAAPGYPTPTNAATFAYDYRDALAAIKHAGVPNDYGLLSFAGTLLERLAQPSWYASPPDVWGRGAVVLDVGGQPLFAYMGQPPAGTPNYGEAVDSPYEICLSGENNNADTPYTVAELERILRYHDPDAPQLPQRILNQTAINASLNLLGGQPGYIDVTHTRRNMLTTLSSDIPAPVTAIPPEFRQAMVTGGAQVKIPGASSILDIYYARLVNGGLSGPQLNNELHKMVPWEFFKGQKFDINRPFGDGVDANGDNVRDEPYESNTGEYAWQGSATVLPNMPAAFRNVYGQTTNTVPYMNGGPPGNTTPNDNLFARQLYARHLFCLAMLFLPPTFQPANPIDLEATTGAKARQLMIRRIAQWAVNCADYKDSDSIMTPFEFDYDPWNGWQVDGRLDTDGTAIAPESIAINGTLTSVQTTERGLVWGMEAPDLLITETLALHDRRVKDTANDNDTRKKRTDTSMPDDDLDQFRIPQGSLFVELYCPRPTRWPNGEQANNKPLLPFDLYDTNTGSLKMGLLAPPANGAQWPVWRLAMSQIRQGDTNQQQWHPVNAVGDGTTPAYPLSASFDPLFPNLLPTTQTPVRVDRYAYLGNASNLPAAELARAFYTTAAPLLAPGQYAVVGPRPITYLGSQEPTTANPSPPAGGMWGGNSRQYIQITGAGGVVVTDTMGNQTSRTALTDMRTPLGIVCAFPAGSVTPVVNGGTPWNSPNPWPIGMNITEPLPGTNYYPEPLYGPTTTFPTTTFNDFYSDPDDTAQNLFKDQPIESPSNPNSTGKPIADNTMNNTGTYFDYSSVYLQRLANPSLPYNPLPYDGAGNPDPNYNSGLTDSSGRVIVNPYVTVDWQTIDVHVFNGEELRTNSMVATPPFDTDDDPSLAANPLKFRTRQRGFVALKSTALQPMSNPWPPVTLMSWPTTNSFYSLPTTTNTYSSGPYFTADLTDNILTSTYTYDSPAAPPADRHTLGYINSTVDRPHTTATAGIYIGESSNNPFPWIAWNNRPFMNPMELLAVPSASPARHFLEMTPGFLTTSATSPYDMSNMGAYHFPFGQMLNFFHTAPYTTAADRSPHLYRILDFVEVPSPYAGAERWYNPTNFGGPTTLSAPNNPFTSGNVPAVAAPASVLYRPPFNKLSRFRDPGKVNINTIFDFDVWDSVVGQFPGLRAADNTANQVFLSRQGYTNPGLLQMNPAYPTRFAHPFRSADSADLMPAVPAGPTGMRKLTAVDATTLRPDPANAALPLFAIGSTNAQYNNWVGDPPNAPTSNPAYVGKYHDVTRNPYFAYQPYQKLGSVLTTRSNCFAVWITIGYFEVEDYRPTGTAVVIDAAHPDGLSLGQEVDADTGKIKRHRAFYIIDRSIPVGFIPGSRLNTDDCVLIRRLIE